MLGLNSLSNFSSITSDELFLINGGYGSSSSSSSSKSSSSKSINTTYIKTSGNRTEVKHVDTKRVNFTVTSPNTGGIRG